MLCVHLSSYKSDSALLTPIFTSQQSGVLQQETKAGTHPEKHGRIAPLVTF